MKRRISAADRPYVDALGGGLVRQGYRRVAIEALNPDGTIKRTRTVPRAVRATFERLAAGSDWIEIGCQLAGLQRTPSLTGLYMRQDTFDVEVVAVCWYASAPLELSRAQEDLDWIWGAIRRLDRYTAEHKLEGDGLEAVKSAADALDAASPYGALLKAAATFGRVQRAVSAWTIFGCPAGLSDDMFDGDELRDIGHVESGPLLSPMHSSMTPLVWDIPAQEMLGGAKSGSLDCQGLHDDVAYALNIAAAE